jgi:hypothetical protein
MRTNIRIDDELYREVSAEAPRSGRYARAPLQSFLVFINFIAQEHDSRLLVNAAAVRQRPSNELPSMCPPMSDKVAASLARLLIWRQSRPEVDTARGHLPAEPLCRISID